MKFKLSLDSNFCGVNDEIYFEADELPGDDELQTYTDDWIGACWNVEEIPEDDEEAEDCFFEQW